MKKNSGMTAIELMMAVGIMMIPLLGAYSLYSVSMDTSKNINEAVFSGIDSRASFGLIQLQLAKSEVMRTGMIKCTGASTLDASTSHSSSTLSQLGDSFSFAYSAYKTLATADIGNDSAVIVPDPSYIPAGSLILLTSLDAQAYSALFKVQSKKDKTVFLTQTVDIKDSKIPCTLTNNTADADNILNRLNQRKLKLDLVRIVSYQFSQSSAQNPNGFDLSYFQYSDLRSKVANQQLAMQNLQSLQITQNFLKPNNSIENSKGDYKVKLNLNYKAITSLTKSIQDQRITLETGYRLGGLEISNASAVPEPAVNDNLYVTCAVTATKITDFFKIDTEKNLIKTVIYQIDATYSESETLNDGRFPNIQVNINNLDPSPDSNNPIQCWNDSDKSFTVTSKNKSELATLKKKGDRVENGFTFDADQSDDPLPSQLINLKKENRLVHPMYCNIPGPAQVVATLSYNSITGSGIQIKNVKCSSADIQGVAKKWKYAGNKSKCTKKGSIVIGRLIGVGDPNVQGVQGPTLYTDDTSCHWSATTETSCSVVDILSKFPDAELLSVDLHPAKIKFKDDTDTTVISCQ